MSNVVELCKVNTYLPIKKLKFHPDNPRTIQPERLAQLKNSITTKGFYQPILVWKKGGYVLSGNHRLLAVKELLDEGWEFIGPDGAKDVLPVVVENVPEEIARAMLFETNNSYADWVDEKLKTALQEAEENGENILDYGFTQDWVDNLLKDALKDAEDILGSKDNDVEGVDTSEADLAPVDRSGEAEEAKPHMELILTNDTYNRLADVIKEIALAISPDWLPGQSHDPAINALCDAIADKKIIKHIQKSIH